MLTDLTFGFIFACAAIAIALSISDRSARARAWLNAHAGPLGYPISHWCTRKRRRQVIGALVPYDTWVSGPSRHVSNYIVNGRGYVP